MSELTLTVVTCTCVYIHVKNDQTIYTGGIFSGNKETPHVAMALSPEVTFTLVTLSLCITYEYYTCREQVTDPVLSESSHDRRPKQRSTFVVCSS